MENMNKIKQDLKPLFEVLPPWAKWIAKDDDGDVFYYEDEPVFNRFAWLSDDYSSIPQEYIPQSYKDLPWKESLVEIKRKQTRVF